MTDIQYNASEAYLSLETELSEDHFDFASQGGNSVGSQAGQQTGVLTASGAVTITGVEIVQDGTKLAPFTVAICIDYLPYDLPADATLNILASFRPPSVGTYTAIMRVTSTTGHQDFTIVGTGDAP
jgi:hypothetical protein